jgi:hypothetical protein
LDISHFVHFKDVSFEAIIAPNYERDLIMIQSQKSPWGNTEATLKSANSQFLHIRNSIINVKKSKLLFGILIILSSELLQQNTPNPNKSPLGALGENPQMKLFKPYLTLHNPERLNVE